MREKIMRGIAAAAVIMIIMLAAVTVMRRCKRNAGAAVETHTEVITVYDTVRVAFPAATDSVVIRYVTRRLPVVRDTSGLDPDIDCVVDTIYLDSIERAERDSADVVVPLVQKRYVGDLYTAYVSGYEARLDSIHFARERTTVIRTQTVVKRKHWGYSVGIQAGYGITAHGFSPYAGVGFTAGYNF